MARNNSISIAASMDEVMANLRMQLEGIPMSVPTWSGTPGMGKTAHAKIIANKLGCQMYYVSMNKPYEFFSGIPVTSHLTLEEAKGQETFTHWSTPDMIHRTNELAKNGPVLIFLDDLHCANDSVQKFLYELILERELNGFKLPKNCCMLAAMNNTSNSGYDGFFAAITTRLQMIRVHMPFRYWYENVSYDIHPFISSFLYTNHEFREEVEDRMGPFANYRSWTMLGKLLKHMYGNSTNIRLTDIDEGAKNIPDKVYSIARGFVSDRAADELRMSVRYFIEFNFEQMVANHSYKINTESIPVQMMFGSIVRYLKTSEQGDEFVAYLDKVLSSNKEASKVSNAIVSIAIETGAVRKFLKNAPSSEEKKITMENLEKIINCLYSHPTSVKVLRETVI